MAVGMGGVGPSQSQFNFGGAPPPANPTDQFGNPATFTAAANTQASDYDAIMKQYADLAKQSQTNPITANTVANQQVEQAAPVSANQVSATNIAPQTAQYKQSEDVTNSLSDLSNLATTGGYSAADIGNIRARDVSPTRSIYANAQQNVERAKALGGGYSPNYDATQAQMARDESNQIATADTNAEAGIAQNVAANKISASGTYASAAGSANSQKTQADQANAAIINQINELNANNNLQAGEFNSGQAQQIGEFNTSTNAAIAAANADRATNTSEFNTNAALGAANANRTANQAAIGGQASLYGTTPALVNTFGNQVIQAGQLGQGQQQLNNQKLFGIGNMSSFGAN